jgi:hypothetical protein
MGLTDQESSCRAIERLIANYAELVDDGEFAVVGRLLADATFSGGAGTANGSDAVEKMLRDNVIVYDDAHPEPSTSRPISPWKSTKRPAQRSRVLTSLCYRRCPTWRCSRSSAVFTTIGSSGVTVNGGS